MTVSKPVSAGLDFLKRSLQFWDSYWFSPAPLFNLAVCRVIIVAFQIGYLFVRDYLTRITVQATIPTIEYQPLPIFELLNAPFPWDQPPTMVPIVVFWLTIITGVLALIGWRCRLSLALFALGNLYIQTYLYSFGRFHHSQALMILGLVILAIAPTGKTFSIDDLNQKLKQHSHKNQFQPFSLLSRQHMSAQWPLLLIQWLFGIVYFSAGIHKLSPRGGGLSFSLDWLNGYTLQYYLLRDGLQWDSGLGVWLSQFHGLAIASSWVAVLFECTFCLTLLFPRLVWLYIPLGTMLHTGIYMAQRAPFFQFIALYSVFVPWSVGVKRIANRLHWSKDSQKADVFFDGLDPFCIRVMTVLCYFDVFGRIRYHNLQDSGDLFRSRYADATLAEQRVSLYAVEPDGSVQKGFRAVSTLTKYIPLLLPLRIALQLPGAVKLYHRAARQR